MSVSKASKEEEHDHEFKLSLEKDQKDFEKSQAIDDLQAIEQSLLL